ncbi:MAG: hypothetical protein A2488_02220 [Candidatus Magasanikbacteria bacterium RIFOXYC12_FULL_32_21b]|nr:MAG: hypothetical protein A2488_02220 [Candidatus Magasanikbacteria bacterium RIFOXYC12_FULL_32_21b]
MFKKLFLAVAISVFLFALPVHAEEKINNFVSNIKINSDASFHVEEKIDYDFENLEKHGIYRDIVYKYNINDKTYIINIDNVSVTDENNNKVNFVVSDIRGIKNIRIGDADILVSGRKTYIINYDVERALNSFENNDELYWNVTGNGWNVPIENVETIIELPTSSPIMDSQVTCYAGDYGSKDTCTSFDFKFVANSTEDISGAVFHTKDLLANQGMSVVLGFAKNIVNIKVEEPLPTIPLWLSIILLIVVFGGLPIFVLIVMILLWYFKGRDENLHDPIIAQYDSPENLPPGVVGTILDERVDKQDVSSEIIYLAIAGYFKINRLESKKFLIKSVDYQLDKLKEADDNLKEYQKILLNAFFKKGNSVKLSTLKYELFADFKKATKEMYNFVSENAYFVKNPNKVRLYYNIIGMVFIGLGMFTFPVLTMFSILGFGVSGVIIILFAQVMSKRTRKGIKAKNYILGLKEYIRVAEKERIKFHNAPEKNPQTFEKFLPYAMVFGLEKEWAKQFEGIYMEEPAWYSGSDLATFSALSFVNELGNFGTVANTSFAQNSGASSGFSSGGFSGGGFGGGGGGSW